MVNFRPFNLLSEYRSLGQFDIVFCRNVLIYFDRETKADILARMAKQMARDAYLVLGAAETIIGLSEDFNMVPGASVGFIKEIPLILRVRPDTLTSTDPRWTSNQRQCERS